MFKLSNYNLIAFFFTPLSRRMDSCASSVLIGCAGSFTRGRIICLVVHLKIHDIDIAFHAELPFLTDCLCKR